MIEPTKVLFPTQQTQATATVMLCQATEQGGTWLVTDQTPFHPVSHIWPDHPADQGQVEIAGNLHPVVACLVGAVELATQTLYVDQAIPVKRDTEGWAFVVVHQLEENVLVAAGEPVTLTVDADHQQALSRGHSGGHLSSLALNKVLHHDFWRKVPSRVDELGYYDFHSYAQTESRVTPDRSTDTYRLGKTLRKRGLNSADMVAQLEAIAARINEQLELWRQSGTQVMMRIEGPALTDSRYWQCDLGEEAGLIEIPCGGTHIRSLAEYARIAVRFELVSEQELVMVTDITPA
ncbi:metal-dependent hydrolase [Photobacterium jeanii]|uniref:Metal-dependent hydrolase n=1 Tax=Photobacterium jeanii TaxID=858640 RepID=A0A178KAD4_9GAMM|nr:metal-dependent hydrolase [Photobacterium jeanii]